MLTCKYRGRFAPSPTGALHAGSLATALASWLHARAHNGIWLIRMEDLDSPRCIKGADLKILSQLAACGMQSDEAVIYQSQRSDAYQAALDQLKSQQQVYACRCTRKRIESYWLELGIHKGRHEELVYPGLCRHKTDVVEPCAWRLRVDHADLEKAVGDFVLKRADGFFTYQLAVVVDDAAQGITHIVRGADLLDNTARQNYLQEQLGVSIPQYHHVPLVLNEANEKLSKQSGALELDLSSSASSLRALQQAALHLGLAEPELHEEFVSRQKVLDRNAIQTWLQLATKIFSYRLAKHPPSWLA